MITFILPIRNEEHFITKTLDSILSQSDDNVEIIIADGLSTDGTREIIQSFQESNHNIQLIDNPEKIVSTGFNRALTMAKGDIIIRVDGHSEIAPNYINRCITQLQNINAVLKKK